MSTWKRIAVALKYTIGLMIAGILYASVFVAELLPVVDTDGIFSGPVFLLNRIVPVVIVIILLAVWAWVIAGAVQQERAVDRRRIR